MVELAVGAVSSPCCLIWMKVLCTPLSTTEQPVSGVLIKSLGGHTAQNLARLKRPTWVHLPMTYDILGAASTSQIVLKLEHSAVHQILARCVQAPCGIKLVPTMHTAWVTD